MEKRIDRLQRLAASRPAVIGLGGGLPATRLFPRTRLAGAFVRALREPAAGALQYAWPEGNENLRRWIAAHLRRRGASVAAADVIVTSGAQQAIAIAAQLLARPGDPVAVDAETYPAALDLFRERALLARTALAGARFAYVMPVIGNPHSAPIRPVRRRALLTSGVPVVEDDAYAELRFDGRTPPPLLATARARVWHVGTFSKTLCPGLRVGWLVPPPEWRERALEAKHASDLQSSSLGQSVLEHFLARDDYEARLARSRRFYEKRAVRLLETVRRLLPDWSCDAPEGGFALYLQSDEDGDDTELLEVATACGVSFDPGRLFRPDENPHPLALRLCFSSAAAPQLEEGVRRLAKAWDAWRRRRDHRARRVLQSGRESPRSPGP